MLLEEDFPSHPESPVLVALSPEGGKFLAVAQDKTVALYERTVDGYRRRESVPAMPVHFMDGITALGVSSDGGTLFVGTQQGMIKKLQRTGGTWRGVAEARRGWTVAGGIVEAADGEAYFMQPELGTGKRYLGSVSMRDGVKRPPTEAVQRFNALPGVFVGLAAGADGSVEALRQEGSKLRSYRLAPGGPALLHEAEAPGEALAASQDGRSRLLSDGLHAPARFLVVDDRSVAVLPAGRSSARSSLAGSVRVLGVRTGSVADPAQEPFRPRYGGKPFYFAADPDGKVHLNFKGRWFATRHRLLAAPPKERRSPVALEDLRHPYEAAERPLSKADFLLETPMLEDVTGSVLDAFEAGWSVEFEGSPGAGKTAIAREAALLLGLPRHVFQMHGERELSDLIGSYREDSFGRLHLTALPLQDGRYRLPLLEALTRGGVFVLDEGAVGDRGREVLSWFSAAARGDKELVLHAFPGHEIRLDVHPDFHLVITNNTPGLTPDRLRPKSEVTAHAHVIPVPEDDAPETLAALFSYFSGGAKGLEVAALHHKLKPEIGKGVGKGKEDRYYLSKREVRRAAKLVRRWLESHPGDEGYALYRALRMAYEAMFTDAGERARVHDAIRQVLGDTSGLQERLDDEVRGRGGWTPWLTEELLRMDEPVMLIHELGARSGDAVRSAAQALSGRLETVDAAPEHTELEVLGGLIPVFGAREPGSPRSRYVRCRLTRHLLTARELAGLAEAKTRPAPVVLWIRNIDQWREDIRTGINGLLEDGYIDLEDEAGRLVRYYKPPYLRFAAEVPFDSSEDVSSAFFNRWIKAGVSRDGIDGVLRGRYGLDPLEAVLTAELYRALVEEPHKAGPAERAKSLGPSVFYALAEALKAAEAESRAWQGLLEQIRASGYDPRTDPSAEPQDPGQRRVRAAYRELVSTLFLREASRLIGRRYPARSKTGLSERARFEAVLKAVSGAGRTPDPEALRTEDGTLESRLEAVGDIPVRAARAAPTLLEAMEETGVRLTEEIVSMLGVFARARGLGRVTAYVGETGTVKTSTAELWAKVTGRRFYKYQSHAGSEYTDLTVDVEQGEAGEFVRRVKEFYQVLRQGNAVVDIDEANVAPWVLWTLEPLLRGERVVEPIFPGEEAFEVGPDVQVVLTFNPERYSGRERIAERLLERMLLARVEPVETGQIGPVIETFYGVWEGMDGARTPRPAVKTPPARRRPARRVGSDRDMRLGKEVIDPDAKPEPSRREGPAEQGVFTPDLYPHTRLEAYGRYDEAAEEFVLDGRLERVPLPGPGDSAAELGATHDLFEGRVSLALGRDWQLLPGAGAPMRVLGIEGAAGIELAKDSADNLYIRTSGEPAVPGASYAPGTAGSGMESAAAEVRYRVAVPARYFGQPVQSGLPFAYPRNIPAEVREAMGLIGLKGTEKDFRDVLYALVSFFRDFSLEKDGIRQGHGSLYLDLVRSRCGVCRNRAFAFARTALGLGIPARYVRADRHAYAEVRVPGLGWLRVDLGGGGDPRDMDLSRMAGERHSPREPGDMPEPERYRADSAAFGERMREAMAEQGGQGAAPGGTGSGMDPSERGRIRDSLDALAQGYSEGLREREELAEAFARGARTEHVFQRLLRSLWDRIRIVKTSVRRGLEIDPVAFMLKKPKQFIRRRRETRMQTTAVAVLFDFSGSMDTVKKDLAYTVRAVGRNFWKLRRSAPEHFYYDLSWFTDKQEGVTVVGMGDRLTEADSDARLAGMTGPIGAGGTDIYHAVKGKLKDFMSSREARGARVKYLLVFTDGADHGSVEESGGRRAPTARMRELLEQCRQAGVELVMIGIGEGAKDVQAFDGQGQHYIRIRRDRFDDIGEAVARVAEHLGRRSGVLPRGDITDFLGLPEA